MVSSGQTWWNLRSLPALPFSNLFQRQGAFPCCWLLNKPVTPPFLLLCLKQEQQADPVTKDALEFTYRSIWMLHRNTHSTGLWAFSLSPFQNSILQGTGMKSEKWCILMDTIQMKLWLDWGRQALSAFCNSFLNNPWNLIFFSSVFPPLSQDIQSQETECQFSYSFYIHYEHDIKA